MKNIFTFIGIIIAAIFIFSGFCQQDNFPDHRGPYLGQKPPGIKAEIFAPEIVSTTDNEILFGFFNNGTMLLFERSNNDFKKDWIYKPVYITKLQNGKWTQPEESPINGKP